MITREDAIYAAAIIDGEGCISLGSINRGRNHALRVTVSMRGEPVIEWLRTTFGGHRSMDRAQHVWTLRSNECREFLVATAPFMKLKARQAEIGLAFLETLEERSPLDRRAFSNVTRLLQQALVDLMTAEKDLWRE